MSVDVTVAVSVAVLVAAVSVGVSVAASVAAAVAVAVAMAVALTLAQPHGQWSSRNVPRCMSAALVQPARGTQVAAAVANTKTFDKPLTRV